MYSGSITDIEGLLVGHAQDLEGLTGVTVLLAKNGAVCGCDVRGSAPGTRETDLTRPDKTVEKINAILLAGGSAYGLAAADGVMIFCEREGMGITTNDCVVPIVPGAVIYDLGYGAANIRPNAGMGYAACVNAATQVQQGSIGAGLGATVGKVLGMKYCEKGGIGTASIKLPGDITVGAIMCVNAFGDIVEDGKIIAGARHGGKYLNTEEYLLNKHQPSGGRLLNTTIGVVATDAGLSAGQAKKLAQTAQNGLVRAINPVHTLEDGDTIFALSCGRKKAEMNAVITAAAEATRRAVINAVLAVHMQEEEL